MDNRQRGELFGRLSNLQNVHYQRFHCILERGGRGRFRETRDRETRLEN